MDFNEFQQVNFNRCGAKTGFDHAVEDWSLSDWLVAAMGELGEAANIAKKLNRHRDAVRGNHVFDTETYLRECFKEEIADTFIYLFLICDRIDVKASDIIAAKWNKTSEKIGYVGRV